MATMSTGQVLILFAANYKNITKLLLFSIFTTHEGDNKPQATSLSNEESLRLVINKLIKLQNLHKPMSVFTWTILLELIYLRFMSIKDWVIVIVVFPINKFE
jgi:hypothetical protein